MLAKLHGLDPDAVGLGDLGRKEAYLSRQLSRWTKQWEASKTHEIPAMEETRRLLEERMPAQIGSGIVHGDYRLGNMIVKGPRILAVLDWELCTLGDPLADVGYLMNAWASPEEVEAGQGDGAPTAAGGFPSRAEMRERYEAATGRDLSGINYYRAFSHWRLAAIGQGVYKRYLVGAMGANRDMNLDGYKAQRARRADAALALISDRLTTIVDDRFSARLSELELAEHRGRIVDDSYAADRRVRDPNDQTRVRDHLREDSVRRRSTILTLIVSRSAVTRRRPAARRCSPASETRPERSRSGAAGVAWPRRLGHTDQVRAAECGERRIVDGAHADLGRSGNCRWQVRSSTSTWCGSRAPDRRTRQRRATKTQMVVSLGVSLLRSVRAMSPLMSIGAVRDSLRRTLEVEQIDRESADEVEVAAVAS